MVHALLLLGVSDPPTDPGAPNRETSSEEGVYEYGGESMALQRDAASETSVPGEEGSASDDAVTEEEGDEGHARA